MSIDREHKMGWIPSLSYFHQTTFRLEKQHREMLRPSISVFALSKPRSFIVICFPSSHRTAMTVEKQTAPIQPKSELLHV
jgi:hypothetical protein